MKHHKQMVNKMVEINVQEELKKIQKRKEQIQIEFERLRSIEVYLKNMISED